MVAVLLVVPAPPSLEVMTPVVLFCDPAAAPVTGTLNMQVALPPALWATDAPVSVIVPVESTVVSIPLQVAVGPESATVNPDGSVSVKAMPVRSPAAVVFGLVMVKFRFTTPFSATDAAANALLIVGGATTVSVAVLLVDPAPLSL